MSESGINPNTPVTETTTSTNGKGTVELSSGETPLTFDELDKLTLSKGKKAAKQESKGAESDRSGDKDDKPETKSQKSKDLSSDSDKGKSQKAESKESSDKKQGQDKEADETKQQQQLRKLIKAKFQDKEIDLDEESIVPVKINGKEEMVQVKDLLANYSGKTAWDKKFTELSKKDKTIAINDLKLKQAAESVKEIFEEQDPDMRIFKMSKFAGLDPVQYREKFLKDNLNLLEKYYSMTEDERKADSLAFEAKYQKHRADTLEQSSKQEHSQRELSAKIESLRASHQVSEDEFSSCFEQVNELVNKGLIEKSQLTPEFVIATVEKERLWNAIDAKLQDFELPWSNEERAKKVMSLVENSHKLGQSPADMAEIVEEIWGPKRAQKKAQTIAQERQEFMSGKKEVTQARSQSSQPMFFDEM